MTIFRLFRQHYLGGTKTELDGSTDGCEQLSGVVEAGFGIPDVGSVDDGG
jgi:hypothetical protein